MNKKVKKNDLIYSIYGSTEFDRNTVAVIVDKLIGELKSSLENGATIELRGFGTFEPRLRKGRKVAHNPKTGELLSVEPHYVAAFRAGQSLKENLWNLDREETK